MAIFRRENHRLIDHETLSKYVFDAFGQAISPGIVGQQLLVKDRTDPQEISSNSSFISDLEEFGQYSDQFDCVETDCVVNVEVVDFASSVPVKGRLRQRITFWKNIGASKCWGKAIPYLFSHYHKRHFSRI